MEWSDHNNLAPSAYRFEAQKVHEQQFFTLKSAGSIPAWRTQGNGVRFSGFRLKCYTKGMDSCQTENSRGEWVPAIPLPYMFWLGVPYTQCHCGKRFFGAVRGRALRRYEEHYALHHILKP